MPIIQPQDYHLRPRLGKQNLITVIRVHNEGVILSRFLTCHIVQLG